MKVKIDRVMADLGLAGGELDAEAHQTLLLETERYARGGDGFSWAEWMQLEEVTQDAFIDAHEAVWLERAASFGLASQGPDQAAAVVAPIDDGDAACQLLVERAADKAAARMAI